MFTHEYADFSLHFTVLCTFWVLIVKNHWHGT
ncbi:hypothetical protein V6Z12_D03G176200 [Gossypium hirsutum]